MRLASRFRPCLTFHGLGEPPLHATQAEQDVWVRADTFEAIIDCVREWDPLITFDDGNATDYTVGLPVVLSRRLECISFVVASWIGEQGYLSRDVLREMTAAGVRIGSHGMDHRNWRSASPDSLKREIVHARRVIEGAAGSAVTEAAIPYGQYDARVLASLREAGYRHVYTSDGSVAREGTWIVPRYSVKSTDTPESIRRVVCGQNILAATMSSFKQKLKQWRP